MRDDLIVRQQKIPPQIVQSWSTDTDDEEDEVQRQQPDVQQSSQDDKKSIVSFNDSNTQTNKRGNVTSFNDTKNIKRCKSESIQDNDLFIGAYKKSDELPSNEEIELNLLAFCCQQSCTCSDVRKARIVDERGPYITACGENSLWHRRCCHGAFTFKENWLSDFEKAQQSMLDDLYDTEKIHYSDTIFLDTEKEVQKKVANATRQESQFCNEDTLADQSSLLLTNRQYLEMKQDFVNEVEKAKKRSNKLRSAVVLDIFGGIGSAIVALKLNGVAMKKVIHVDHDKIATHVHRWNHDPNYCNPLLVQDDDDDDCEHIYDYTTFEEIRDNLETFLHEHGPIDIVIGGPPCVDYSGANANREGTEGAQGSYMVQFGNFIQSIQLSQSRTVYFLAENTVLRNCSNKDIIQGDLSIIEKAFGLTFSVEYDAKDVSPCNRLRTYLTNIPFEIDVHDAIGAQSSLSMFLEDGYKHPMHLKNRTSFDKANCFMAHKGRINDDRMLVYKKLDDDTTKKRTFVCRHINVSEREVLMGFPKNYVQTPVSSLFQSIHQNAFGNGFQTDPRWQDSLESHYHCFADNFHKLDEGYRSFKFEHKYLEIVLKIAIPQTTKHPSYFTAEGYCKHLIGNAFSVPVVAIFLRPLQQLFATKEYNGYSYEFPWMEHLLNKV